MNVYIDNNLHGSKLKQFVDFVKKISNTYSIARDFNGSFSEDELQVINKEQKDYFLQKNKERKENYLTKSEYRQSIYKALGISNSEEALRYFDLLLNQDIEVAESVSFGGEDHKFESKCDDLVKVQYTRVTTVTIGGIFEVCYFIYGPMLSEILSQMNYLFNFPYNVESYQFMDIAFYNGEEVKLAICSHEQYASLCLNEEEYNEFLTLNIPHNV